MPSLQTQVAPQQITLNAAAVVEFEAGLEAGGGGASLPRFRMVAYTGAPMRISGWRHPLVVDLAGMNIPSQARPIRFGHDPLSGVGHTDAIAVEQGQLIAAGLVSRDTGAAREVVTSARNGFPWQASIGASVEEFEFIKENQSVTVNGRSLTGPLNVVRRSTLGEVSFVDLGADGATSVSVAAQSGVGADGQAVAGQSPGPVVPSASGADELLAAELQRVRDGVAAEMARHESIRRICGGQHAQLEAQAIRDGWNEQRTELEVLRATRPTAPAIHRVDHTVSGELLEAACYLSAGLSTPQAHIPEQALDAADRRYRGGLGLQELFLEAAWANGYSGRNFRDARAIMRHAFGHGVEAAYSTIDIGSILSNVANKFLLEGFFSVERTWLNICAVRNVTDFKTVNSYRLVGKDQYELVAPGGEIKHGTLGNEQYSNKADTYALMLQIDRRDIINDDLGAITTVPRKLGRGSGLKINDVFWKTFMDNAAFFTAGNKNFISGASTALSIDGLTEGEVKFLDQVDAEGKPIGVMPVSLLVPTALSALATQLYKSLEMRDTTANTKAPITNPHQGKFRVEVSRYLGNAQYTGNSSKAWYLLAEATDLPVIEVAFLNGQESPTIETADADFSTLGVRMRGYHDFGCALQDPRGGLRAKGEA